MRLLLVYLVPVIIAVTVTSADSAWQPRDNAALIRIRDECLKAENVAADDAAKILRNDYPDNPAVHCYVLCTSIKVGTWDENDGPHIDRTQKQILQSGNKISQAELLKCKPEKLENKCLWAYNGLMCILKSSGVVDEIIKSK